MKRMICNLNSIIWTKVRTVSIMATKKLLAWEDRLRVIRLLFAKGKLLCEISSRQIEWNYCLISHARPKWEAIINGKS